MKEEKGSIPAEQVYDMFEDIKKDDRKTPRAGNIRRHG